MLRTTIIIGAVVGIVICSGLFSGYYSGNEFISTILLIILAIILFVSAGIVWVESFKSTGQRQLEEIRRIRKILEK